MHFHSLNIETGHSILKFLKLIHFKMLTSVQLLFTHQTAFATNRRYINEHSALNDDLSQQNNTVQPLVSPEILSVSPITKKVSPKNTQ